jgi:hypothetical protein
LSRFDRYIARTQSGPFVSGSFSEKNPQCDADASARGRRKERKSLTAAFLSGLVVIDLYIQRAALDLHSSLIRMSLEAWNTEKDDKTLLDHMNEGVINPLLSLKSAPFVLQEGTVKAAEYVGSRSKIEIERVKMITKTIIDAETRARTYGSGSEWRKWVRDNILYMNGTPMHKEILLNLPSGITVALVGHCSVLDMPNGF